MNVLGGGNPGNSAEIQLRELEPADECALEDVTSLHMELLHFGPMARLGRDFIREVCYRIHLQDGLLRGAVFKVDERAAGFVVFTDRSVTFHRSSLRRDAWQIGRTLLKSLVERPGRIRDLGRAARVLFSRRAEQEWLEDPLGEVVCIAVRPEYLTRRFVDSSGVLISEELIEYSLSKLKESGVDRVRMLVDESNKAPMFLYHRLGATMRKVVHGGESAIEVSFDLATRA